MAIVTWRRQARFLRRRRVPRPNGRAHAGGHDECWNGTRIAELRSAGALCENSLLPRRACPEILVLDRHVGYAPGMPATQALEAVSPRLGALLAGGFCCPLATVRGSIWPAGCKRLARSVDLRSSGLYEYRPRQVVVGVD